MNLHTSYPSYQSDLISINLEGAFRDLTDLRTPSRLRGFFFFMTCALPVVCAVFLALSDEGGVVTSNGGVVTSTTAGDAIAGAGGASEVFRIWVYIRSGS